MSEARYTNPYSLQMAIDCNGYGPFSALFGLRALREDLARWSDKIRSGRHQEVARELEDALSDINGAVSK